MDTTLPEGNLVTANGCAQARVGAREHTDLVCILVWVSVGAPAPCSLAHAVLSAVPACTPPSGLGSASSGDAQPAGASPAQLRSLIPIKEAVSDKSDHSPGHAERRENRKPRQA